MDLTATLLADPAVVLLCKRLADGPPVAAAGLWGSSAPILAAAVAKHVGRPLLYLTAHLEQADHARDDMETAVSEAVELFPAWETLPGEGAGAGEIAEERTRVCLRLSGDPPGPPGMIVAPAQALMQPVPTQAGLAANSLDLAVGQQIDPEGVTQWLVDRGFSRLDQVESPRDFALRGGILDVYAAAETDPLRIEFFGDQIESIRQFEPGSQRSVRTLDRTRITLPPDAARAAPSDTTSLLNYLDPRTLVVLHEPLEVIETARTVLDRLGNPVGHFTIDAILQRLGGFAQLYVSRFAGAAVSDERTVTVSVEAVPAFESKATDAVQQLITLARDEPVIVQCDNEGERDRLRELIDQVVAAAAKAGAPIEPPTALDLRIGLMHHGFRWRTRSTEGGVIGGLTVVAHHEVFRRYIQPRRIRKVAAGRPIDSFLELNDGDYIVHVTHGIGRFMGMKTMRKAESKKSEEFLTVRFADNATIHVPVSQIDLVQKYVGVGHGRPPLLSKLGGARWQATKAKVEEAVDDMAADLLRIQAVRESQPGIAFPSDTHWQTEFENAFPYTETPDQNSTIREIKSDMARARPMDRLLCGDVGYGKTELAMRAAFKAIEFGKQVAVLVPTTVLAEQHYRTFKERMADYPFKIDRLNRFRPPGEQRETIALARKGQVDVLIGTHRILSKDVDFADLGLVIVDEEQRFGVEHKERLKHLRTTVDVLTLTATPIPRTLHMSMIGLRDISSLSTPPMDRRAIGTRVSTWSDELIREAIHRELNRDGQVYFVHNRVRTIQGIAARVASIAPTARILVGHGQMHGDELEEVMMKFINREADILVCTTIIEAGLDIPNANTIFIDRADMFGLADLHQLRGRVGRYKHRAYCYLLLSPNRPITDTAAKRLKAIEEFSDLGAGFRIAMRDLEIRGAGNILGAEQSGNIAAVGYELYCQLLEHSVKRMKGEKPPQRVAVNLELDVEAYIPTTYIASDRQRMECYRRVAACRSAKDVDQLEKDLLDAFGRFPSTVETLLLLAEIKVRAAPWGIQTIIRREPDVIITFDNEVRKLEPLFAKSQGKISFPDPHTLYWRLPEQYFRGDTLLTVLRNLFRRADGATETGPSASVASNTDRSGKPVRASARRERPQRR